MDKETIINTVQSMRDYIHRINLEGPQYQQAWDEIQSADHLIEELSKTSLVLTSEAVSAATSAAEPYLNNLAALRGALQELVKRNPGIVFSRDPGECFRFTNDFITLYNAYLKDVIFPGGKHE